MCCKGPFHQAVVKLVNVDNLCGRCPPLARRAHPPPTTCTVSNITYNHSNTTPQVTVSGAVRSPLYRHKQTTTAQWSALRMAPGPWAELDAGPVVLMVPSEVRHS